MDQSLTDPPAKSEQGTAPVDDTVPNVPDGATVTPGAHVHGVAGIVVNGHSLHVTITKGFSGIITQPVTVTIDGQDTVVYLHLRSYAAAVKGAHFTIAPAKTIIRWTKSANALGYVVIAGHTTLCKAKAAASSCTVSGLYGPKRGIKVVALGGNNLNTQVNGTYLKPANDVLTLHVMFAPDSPTLTAASKQHLHELAVEVAKQGFTSMNVSGFAAHFATSTSAADKAHRSVA